MKALSSPLFHIFCLLFLFFSWAFMDYWNSNMTDEDTIAANWMNRATAALVAYCLFICIINFRTSYKGIHLVCLLWVMIMPVIIWVTKSSIFAYASTILWPLLFEMGYMFCHEWEERGDSLRKMMVVIALFGLFLFIQTRFDITKQSNTIYFVLLTSPWLLYGQNKQTQRMLLIFLSVLVLFSMKRSAMLVMVVVWLFYVLEMLQERQRKIGVVFFVILFSVGAIWVFDTINARVGGLLQERVNKEETEEGRDRLAIWEITRSMIVASPKLEWVTGHGHFGVKKDSPLELSAHNDFLEVMYDYGIVIFILYLCLWGHVIRRTIFLYKARSSLFLPYAMSLSLFLVLSMVSHLILYTSYFNFLVLFWGMTEGVVMSEELDEDEIDELGIIETSN